MKINNKNIDLNLYRTFFFVAETGSLSKAAEKLYVSQPSISYSIKALESALDVKLFNRTGKGVEVTPEGKNLKFYVESAYNSLIVGERIINTKLNHHMGGELSIGVPSHIGVFFLSKFIQNFSNRYPNVKIHVTNRSTSSMIELLELHSVDLIIDATPIIGKNKKIIIEHITDFDCCFASHKNSKYYKDKKIFKVNELDSIPLILPGKSNNNRTAIDNHFAKYNIKLDPIIEVSSTDLMIDFVKRDMGVGYFIKDSIQEYLDTGLFEEIVLNHPLPSQEIAVAYIEEYITVAAKKFLEMFNDYGINIEL